MNDIARESLLYDFYGELLTDKKRRVMELYHEENLTLAEIAEEAGISRAAVHDSLKSAERKLAEYEEKLGLVDRMIVQQEAHRKIGAILQKMEQNPKLRELAETEIGEIRGILQELASE